MSFYYFLNLAEVGKSSAKFLEEMTQFLYICRIGKNHAILAAKPVKTDEALVLSDLVGFDKTFALAKIQIPGQRREAPKVTSIPKYIHISTNRLLISYHVSVGIFISRINSQRTVMKLFYSGEGSTQRFDSCNSTGHASKYQT